MRQAITLLGALLLAFELGYQTLGFTSAYQVGYGAISITALTISATFLWLWWVRATPLALGMAFSWAGAGSVMGWWWIYSTLGQPEVMLQNKGLFLFVAIYLVGAILHFRVIQQTMSWSSVALAVPVGGAIALSLGVWAWQS